MDARRNQFYNALFRIENGAITRLCEDRAVAAADLFSELCCCGEKIIIAGDGAGLCVRLIEKNGFSGKFNYVIAPENLRYQRGYSVGAAAVDFIKNGGQPIPPELLVPTYLRPSQAERELSLKKKKTAV